MSADRYFILDGDGNVVPATMLEWATFRQEAADRCIVASTEISRTPYNGIATVFTGHDHDFINGFNDGRPPLIFETLVFRDGYPAESWSYATRNEALRGHARAVELAKVEVEVEVEDAS